MSGTQSYWEHRSKFSASQLKKYEGEYVAFSSDGKQVLHHAATELALCEKLDEAGLDPTAYEVEYIPPSDTALIL